MNWNFRFSLVYFPSNKIKAEDPIEFQLFFSTFFLLGNKFHKRKQNYFLLSNCRSFRCLQFPQTNQPSVNQDAVRRTKTISKRKLVRHSTTNVSNNVFHVFSEERCEPSFFWQRIRKQRQLRFCPELTQWENFATYEIGNGESSRFNELRFDE